jgi:hypothetical protein
VKTIIGTKNGDEQKWKYYLMAKKPLFFYYKKWKINNAWFKVYLFLVAILQVKPDLYILNSIKLCQTRRLYSQPMNEVVIMTLLFLMYHLEKQQVKDEYEALTF